MRKFGPAVFKENSELEKTVEVFGPATAKGSLAVRSIKVYGPMTVKETLDVESCLRVNGPLVVKGAFISLKDTENQINGPVVVKKGIIGGIHNINGPIEAEYIDVEQLLVNGPMNIKGDVNAAEFIKIGLGHSSKNQYLEIGGTLEAPMIYLKNYGRKVPGLNAITKILNINAHNKREVVLENLTIRAKVLKLKGVSLINCDVQADQIIDYSQDENLE